MSAVDVLAVLDWFAYPEARPEIGTVARATKGKSIDDLRQASAAVSELIEADKELDLCEAMLRFAVRTNDPKSPEEWEQASRWRDLRDAVRAAKKRRAAALANIGAAP